MHLIKEITDKTIGEKHIPGLEYKIRKAARAIVTDKNGLIPILFASKDNYYKLPGGGIDEGEEIIEGLEREFIEEVGAEVEIEDELGLTIEIKDQHKKIQFSYIYIGKIKKIVGKPQFTQKEIDDGLELYWMKPKDVLEKIRNTNPSSYVGKIIRDRDLAIFKYYLVNIEKNNI